VKQGRILPVLVVAAAVGLYVPRLWLPEAASSSGGAGPSWMLLVGAFAKLACLVGGAVFSALAARQLEPGSLARRAWGLLSLGLGGFSLGQAGLMAYQLVLQREAPLPSAGDAGFLLGYALMIPALIGFVRVYLSSGLPVGSARGHAVVAALALAAALVVGTLLLAPVARADVALGEKALNIAYPTLDFLALVPCLVLVRMAWALRGGEIARVWASLLAGFVLMAAGDILFAYFSSIKNERLGPLVDLTLLLGYFFAAWGAVRQRQLAA
jgi:hypothetical protein